MRYGRKADARDGGDGVEEARRRRARSAPPRGGVRNANPSAPDGGDHGWGHAEDAG